MTQHRLHVLIPGAHTTLITPGGDRHLVDATGRGDDPWVVAAHFDSLITRTGGWRSAAAIVVPSGPEKGPGSWAAVASRMAFPAVVVSRPLAVVSGLGLAPGSARLVIDVRDDSVEISAVTEDGVVASEPCAHSSISGIAGAARSVFTRVDPDHEWTIRQEGVDVLTERFDRNWTERLAAALGIAVQVTDDPVAVLHAGVKADRAAIERCLPTATVGTSRRPPLYAADLTRAWNGLRHQ